MSEGSRNWGRFDWWRAKLTLRWWMLRGRLRAAVARWLAHQRAKRDTLD